MIRLTWFQSRAYENKLSKLKQPILSFKIADDSNWSAKFDGSEKLWYLKIDRTDGDLNTSSPHLFSWYRKDLVCNHNAIDQIIKHIIQWLP